MTKNVAAVNSIQAENGSRLLFDRESLNRHIVRLAAPAVGENLLHTTLLIVDTLMVGYYGSLPVAASAAAGTILWRAHMTFGCIERGTTALVARACGAGDLRAAARAFAQSALLATVLGLVLTGAGVVLAPYLLLGLQCSPEVVAEGTPYLRVIFLASVPRLVYFVGAATLRAAGDTRSPMWITFGMNISNMVFNYVLIFGKCGFPELKLLGSGISTALSILLACGAVLWLLRAGRFGVRPRLRDFAPDFAIVRKIVRLAAPSLLEEITISVGFLTFFSFVARLGTQPLAAHALATRLESLSFMAGFGFAVAASTLVGQSLGMCDVRLARLSFRRTIALTIAVMSCVAVALVMWGRPLLSYFCREAEVLELAYAILVLSAIEQPLLGIAMTLSGGLRGAGDTVSPMITSVVGNLFIRIFVVYWLTFPLGLGIFGVVLGTIVDWVVRCVLLAHFYWRGKWKQVEL
ncbi:MAG: MATE family efflux transporter [Candidatus Sumerlaea sp.]|jgi:putative MATE family efflux protein|uniref:Multidrug-efflux transporter n=1 Tax=Sumerlaea chitinivorans TaxID=2250252 RepID=A0A2Z4Y7N7_SUMC1|nr:Na+-driven multidrug efflux pump [Candidatus Sumerlaea chitinivorans]GIX43879.1 MAG: MATE family efflux transporter [Candidatus Sumerlaea sp.]